MQLIQPKKRFYRPIITGKKCLSCLNINIKIYLPFLRFYYTIETQN